MSPLTSHMASFKPFLPKKGWNSLPFILWPFRGARHTEEYQGFYFHSTLQENKVDSSGSSTPVRRATDSDVSCSSAVTTSFNVTTSSESSSAKLHCVYELKDKLCLCDLSLYSPVHLHIRRSYVLLQMSTLISTFVFFLFNTRPYVNPRVVNHWTEVADCI